MNLTLCQSNIIINHTLMSESRGTDQTLLGSKLEEELKISKTLKESVYSHFDNSQYSVMNMASSAQLVVFEFIAVFLFTFTICSSTSVFEYDIQAAGAMLMATCLTAPFCGANLSPMVTLSNCLKSENKYTWKRLPIYLSAQLLGAVAGLFWSELLEHKMQSELLLQTGDIWRVVSNQAMGVFIFIYFMLLLSNPNTTFIENELTGFMSVTIFYYIARSFAPFANSTLNPAFTIGICIQYAAQGKWTSFGNCWAWLLGDLIGCLCATYFYEYLYKPLVRQLREIRRKEEIYESERYDEVSSQ